MGVALPSDLCTVNMVEDFLAMQYGNAAEKRLHTLISALTDYLSLKCVRSFPLQYISELRNGTGQMAMSVLNPPVVQLIGVQFLGTALTVAADDSHAGPVADTETVSMRGSFLAGSAAYYQDRFPLGHLNIRLNYVSGWQLPNQGTADWQALTSYYPYATIQPLSNNAGGYIYAYQLRRGRAAAMSGSTTPVFNQTPGGVTGDGAIIWTNLGLTTMPDALPLSFQEACCEIVATRYRQQSRWADTGTGIGPERVNYFIGDMNASTAAIVQAMTNVAPIMQ